MLLDYQVHVEDFFNFLAFSENLNFTVSRILEYIQDFNVWGFKSKSIYLYLFLSCTSHKDYQASWQKFGILSNNQIEKKLSFSKFSNLNKNKRCALSFRNL